MARVTASTEIDADVARVWEALEPIESHAQWMADAERIEFDTDQRRGAGTTFIAHTKVGPIRLADRMEITTWEPGSTMGVRHSGVVTGSGAFALIPIDNGRRTRMVWDEQLQFPWYLGGPIGGYVGGTLLLGRIWRHNLRRFRAIVEREQSDGDRCES